MGALVLIVLTAGCGGEEATRRVVPVVPRALAIPSPSVSTTTTTTTSLPVPPGLSRDVVASVWTDYLHMRSVMTGLRRQGARDSPLLDAVLTNTMLTYQRQQMAVGLDDGDFLDASSPAVLLGARDLGPRLVELDVCLEEGGEVQRCVESMIAEGGVWKYAGRQSRTAEPGECPGF